MKDPLTLLRNRYMNEKEIVLCDDHVIIGDYIWPKDTKTKYVMWGSGRDGSSKEYYTLGCIVYFLGKLTYPHAMYVRQAAAENIPVVRRPDRKEMLAYLKGQTSTNSAIDKSGPIQNDPPTRIRGVSPDGSEDDGPEGASVAAATSTTAPGEEDASLGPPPKRPRGADGRGRGGCVILRMKGDPTSRLGAERSAFVAHDNIKSLCEAMSLEKIAAIKAKRLAKKRKTIAKDEEGAVVGKGREGAGKEALLLDEDVTRTIIARERQYSTRTTVLQSVGSNFAKSILAILHSIKAREHGRAVPGARGWGSRGPRPPGAAPAFGQLFNRSAAGTMQVPGTYNRYDQERFIQQKKETEGFKIDTMGTYHGMSLESVTGGKTPRRSHDSFTPTPTTTPTPTPSPARDAHPPSQRYQHTQEQMQTGLVPAIMKRVSRTPIIIIPASATSLISMYNAKDILQDLRFVSTEARRAEGARRDNELLLQRRKEGGLTVPYRVLDNPRKLQPHDWDRVVAVFVMGPAWQFKGWPWGGNPVHIFAKICAFHLKYDEIRLDPNVARWAVNVIELSRIKRHLDRAALKVFWEKLDRHMIKFKSHLRF